MHLGIVDINRINKECDILNNTNNVVDLTEYILIFIEKMVEILLKDVLDNFLNLNK